MHIDTLLVVGAGGHSKVVVDALLLTHPASKLAIADDNPAMEGRRLLGISVIAPIESATKASAYFHVAIGNNGVRARLTQDLLAMGMFLVTVAHPTVTVANSVIVGEGCFLAAGAVVAPDASLGEGCIVNHGAVVDHDCQVGSFSHIAPNASLGGQVKIGERVLIGAGATILPGVKIGDDCIVGAGAVVLNELQSGATYIGIPARKANS